MKKITTLHATVKSSDLQKLKNANIKFEVQQQFVVMNHEYSEILVIVPEKENEK